jgi:hypothetical protein
MDEKEFDEEITFVYTGDGEWNVLLSNGFPLAVYMPLDKAMEFVQNHLEEKVNQNKGRV